MEELLPRSLLSALEREAEKRGTTPEAVMVEMLLRLATPDERPRILLEAAEKSLERAKRLAEKGGDVEALRAAWTAALLALDSLEPPEEEPGGLERYWRLSLVAEEKGAPLEAWYAALAAGIAAKSGLGGGRHVEKILGLVAGLVEALRRAQG